MEPTPTPPWRVLDTPAAGGEPSSATPTGPESATSVVRIDPTRLRWLGLAVGAIACAAVAFALALGGSDPAVRIDGGSPLGIVTTSDDPAGSSGLRVAAGDSGAVELVVEIVGAVPRPGVYRLPAGSRIGDLVTAGGGYGPRVDTARAEMTLNLAAPLHDGDQIRVPSRDDVEPAGATAPGSVQGTTGGALVDLNTATQAELEELPGIGPATAQKIMAAREEAPFGAVDELRSRGILGEKTFEKLRDLVEVR
ncbi:MAG: helix-hairpin-helix domain-containing protein [Candidatus Limnocylindrales bacterium]